MTNKQRRITPRLGAKNTQAKIRSGATGSLRIFVPVSVSERLQRIVNFHLLPFQGRVGKPFQKYSKIGAYL